MATKRNELHHPKRTLPLLPAALHTRSMDYRRLWQAGGTYFFTVNLLRREGNDLLVRHIDRLRESVAWVRRRHPFIIHAWVVLPDHLHCIIELPSGDADFAVRWRLIKQRFSRGIPATESRSMTRVRRGERGVWQRRYWEHLVRDQADFDAHMNYVHINPLKHGLVSAVADWPFSTFHACVAAARYPRDWGRGDMPLPTYED
ncbi:transposase [Uliginosibacterium paludis]|uniref:Transposase n=1 Tax=Uliginosibacterium paludis TaxID=1615952 RepID=A0ABV2CVV6_9RHOO